MVKQLHTNLSLLIAFNLCQPHYQNLQTIYLKLIAKNVVIKTGNLSVNLKGLRIINFLIIAKSVKKTNKTVKTNEWIN